MLETAGAKVITNIKVNDYLFGYEDKIFSVLSGLSRMLSRDSKKVPHKFGVLMKVGTRDRHGMNIARVITVDFFLSTENWFIE